MCGVCCNAQAFFCICDQYSDVAYVIRLVNAGHQMLIVARINRSSLFGELEPIKEVDDSCRNPLLYFIHSFLQKNV